MAAKTTIYVAAPKTAEEGKPDGRRLIRGYSKANVGRYLADEWLITAASPDDLVALLPAGVKVEKAEAPEDAPGA